MTGIALTIVLGHPLATTPVVQATVPTAENTSTSWVTAVQQGQSQQEPGPSGPPVVS